MDEPQVSIVIVSYNVQDLLRGCLRSVFEGGEEIPLEVIVVDNASHDGSVEMVRGEFPQAKLILNDQNLGFAKATNQGIQKSKGKYILLLNPDTVLYPGALREMVRGLDDYPKVGIVAPKLVNSDGSLQLSCLSSLFYSWWTQFVLESNLWALLPLARRRLGGTFLAESFDGTPNQVDFAGGACILARRGAVESVGLLDERFFMYSEDMDWCFRMRNKRWKVLYWPSATVKHFGGGSTQATSVHAATLLRQSRFLFYKKNFGAVRALTYRLAVLLAHLLRVLRKLGTGKMAEADVGQHFALIRWAICGCQKRPD